ncbi:hypothetical protein [Streptomyces sp. AK02-01A]|uniref:hypothetical protein n=1 Tax=Streptomyces sp. AK02-01A TaxID=3028648 RepID=UPI0029A6CD20|nr:hypothetical protein [Streptomyces sp. AK02-01A]MDX3853350.1 hypothetical protein [Streptomyces sp. AK02-01A]
MTERFDFNFELRDSLTARIGRKAEWPYSILVARDLLDLIHTQLGQPDMLRFLRCAEAASRAFKDPRNRASLYSDHLSQALARDFATEHDRRQDAVWNIFLAAHRITGQEQCDLLVGCAIEALQVDLALVP